MCVEILGDLLNNISDIPINAIYLVVKIFIFKMSGLNRISSVRNCCKYLPKSIWGIFSVLFLWKLP